jgi:uncharacterized protein (TIGR03118 family)
VPSRFIFATTAGTILGWSADADPQRAVLKVDGSMAGAAYTGLAISEDDELLYAANFAAGRVDVFDGGFVPVTLDGDRFVDPEVPEGYSPFGVHAIDGRIFVAYAQVDPEEMHEEIGPGLGRVAIFATDGRFVDRFESTRSLNAPWGIALAPDEFGRFGGALLVGNFGDGRITAYDAGSYDLLGQLQSGEDEPIEIEGLWALAFGNDEMAGESDDLYFTAGPGDEMHGVFGEVAVRGE